MLSKMINMGTRSGKRAAKLAGKMDGEEDKQTRIQKIAGKLSNMRFFKHFDIFDDLEMFSVKEALEYEWDRFLRRVTFRHFRQQVGSGLAYFKQGYEAYDFDSAYAMYIFLWKLERLAKVMNDNDRHVGDLEQAKKIKEVIRLINRVMEDDYHEEFEKEVTAKYGDSIRYEASTRGVWGFANKDKGPFKNRHTGSISFNKREKETPENYKKVHKAERRAYLKADKKRKKEWKKALNIIEENFFAWWD